MKLKDVFRFYRKLWSQLERLGFVFLGLVILGILLYNLGFPKTVEETVDAVLLTESGETIPCSVRLKGEITHYPFKKHGSGVSDTIQVYAEGWLLGSLHGSNNPDFLCVKQRDVTIVLRHDLSVFLAECDVQRVFPEKDGMRCVLAFPAMDAAQISALLETLDLEESFLEPFSWVKK